jgi:hypothetical protein
MCSHLSYSTMTKHRYKLDFCHLDQTGKHADAYSNMYFEFGGIAKLHLYWERSMGKKNGIGFKQKTKMCRL